MTDIERRYCDLGIAVEEREGKTPLLRGHAALFNQLSEDLGGYREQIAPGAFAEAIGRDDVRLLINHDGLPLARTASKTLRLSENERGLAFDADPDPDDVDWQTIQRKLARRDVSQMSFAFSVRPNGQDWAKDDEGRVIRTLKKVRLFDVSIVTYPAYPQTDVGVRELRAWEESQRPRTPWKLIRALQAQAGI
jgi:uncharacterized protein